MHIKEEKKKEKDDYKFLQTKTISKLKRKKQPKNKNPY